MARERIRVFQLLNDGAYGGLQRSVEWLAGVADRTRFEHYYAFQYAGGPICDALVSMGYTVEVLHWRHGYSIAGRWRLARLLRRIRPDVIHDHSVTPLTRVVMRAAAGCPIAASQHGVDTVLPSLNLICARLDDRLTDVVIANSQHIAGAHSKLYRRPMSGIRTVYLGLDLERYDHAQKGARRGDGTRTGQGSAQNPRIAFVGRLEAIKGVLELPVLAGLLKEQGLAQFEIAVAGDGPAREACAQLAQDLGVSQHLTFLGWQSDVPALFQGADLCVFPTLADEAFGLVGLEALAAGLPVVAYDVGGVREALGSAPGAQLVPRGDTRALATAVIATINRLGKHDPAAGLAYVRDRFDIRQTARQLEALYTALVRRNP